MKSLIQYLDLFKQQRHIIDSNACDVMNAPREEAYTLLRENDFPNRKTENYLYTDVEAAFAPNLGMNLSRVGIKVNPDKVFRCHITNMNAHAIYVKGDTPALSSCSIEGGVIVARMADFEAMTLADGRKGVEVLTAYYNKLASKVYDAPTALNTLFVQDAIVVFVPKGVKCERPLQIVNVSTGRVDMFWNRRILVVMEPRSEATIIACEEAPTQCASLTLQTMEVVVGEEAKLKLYSIEETTLKNTRFSQVYIEEADAAQVEYGELTLHNGKTRNTVVARLRGDDARFDAYGTAFCDTTERIDNNILVEHIGLRGESDMLHKYVMEGESFGAYAGKVLVHEGAQHTHSEQQNANLCVGDDARVQAQPMLEIYADDVRCNHGSTIGKLDMNALFYMRQRGIPLPEARLLLQHAFVNDVILRISVLPLRKRISEMVSERFRKCDGEKCKTCRLMK